MRWLEGAGLRSAAHGTARKGYDAPSGPPRRAVRRARRGELARVEHWRGFAPGIAADPFANPIRRPGSRPIRPPRRGRPAFLAVSRALRSLEASAVSPNRSMPPRMNNGRHSRIAAVQGRGATAHRAAARPAGTRSAPASKHGARAGAAETAALALPGAAGAMALAGLAPLAMALRSRRSARRADLARPAAAAACADTPPMQQDHGRGKAAQSRLRPPCGAPAGADWPGLSIGAASLRELPRIRLPTRFADPARGRFARPL